MKQGNPQKKMGKVAMLIAMIGGMFNYGVAPADTPTLMQQKNILLTNGGRAPIPFKTLNQRQKRKRYRQVNRCS